MRTLVPDTSKTWHVVVLLALAVLLVYGGTLDYGLVRFDDGMQLLKSPWHPFDFRVDSLSVLIARPLTRLSQRLDLALFGDDYWGHHAANLFYHFLASCAAFAVASRLLSSKAWGAAAALVFALHPLQSESVAYLAGRRDLLCGLLSLAAFSCWICGRRAACASLWLLSLAAKPSSLALPLAFLAHHALLHKNDLKRHVAEGRALYVPLAAAGLSQVGLHLWTELAQRSAKAFPFSQLWYGGTIASQWATEPRIIAHALKLLVWPAELTADYSLRVFEPARSCLELKTWLALALLGGVAWAAWRLRRREPLMSFGLCWIAISYAPMIHLLPTLHNHEPFAEHWLYLPVFGAALIAARLLQRLSRRRPAAAWAGAAALLALLGVRTVARNRDWKDDLTLWSSAAKAHPECARARMNLGLAFFRRGRLNDADANFQRALELRPEDHRILINLAELRLAQGRPREAEAELLRAQTRPLAGLAKTTIDYDLGRANAAMGRILRAQAYFGRVPGKILLSARLNHAQRIEPQGQAALAESLCRRNLAQDPDHVPTLIHLGALLLREGRAAEAVALLERAVTLQPSDPGARFQMGLAYAETGAFVKSHRQLKRLLEEFPRSGAAWTAYSALHLKWGLLDQAWEAGRRAVELDPTPSAYRQLQLVRLARERAAAQSRARP